MTTIMHLNQDILNEIFSYFSIYELIDIEEVCRAFKSTCELSYKSKRFHSFKMDLKHLKVDYLDAIFNRVAETMRSYEFSGGYNIDEDVKRAVVKAISKYCCNVNKLTINNVKLQDKQQFKELQKSFENLTYLDLSHCSINEALLGYLDGEKLKNIKILKLAGNSRMVGEFFYYMKHVEVLDVSFCFQLEYYMFEGFLKNCIKLVELDISGCHQIIPDEADIFEELLQYQPNLEKLQMNDVGVARNEEILSKFKNLKSVSVTGRVFGVKDRINLRWGYL